MLLKETVFMKWNSRNINWYSSRGYVYTKIGDCFTVSVCDLPRYSQVLIDVKCDYCGTQYKTKWATYVKGHNSGLEMDCCSAPKCTGQKSSDVIALKYGVKYSAYLPSVISKRKNTCIERYGVENPFSSQVVKDKIVTTNLAKYGVKYSQQKKEIREKTKRTCLQRYGVENYVELFAGKFIGSNSPVWKGGVQHSRVERATHEYISWRTSVYKRDTYRCQCCGAKNEAGKSHGSVTLNAHHILNWADNPDERYVLNNGITLCDKCHTAFHQEYGKHHTTAEQLNAFICRRKDMLNLQE